MVRPSPVPFPASFVVKNGSKIRSFTCAGIPIPGLEARDGLAAINGSNLLTAMSALHLVDMERWLKQAEIACAMSLEALLANMKPYDVRLHELRLRTVQHVERHLGDGPEAAAFDKDGLLVHRINSFSIIRITKGRARQSG